MSSKKHVETVLNRLLWLWGESFKVFQMSELSQFQFKTLWRL